MNNKTLFACLLATVASATITAQEDYTSSIVNPTIVESNGVNSYETPPTGWAVRKWTNGSEAKVVKGVNANTFLQTWTRANTDLDWDFYQDITSLPEGLYALKADAFAGLQDNLTNPNVVLYAITSVGEYQLPVPYHSPTTSGAELVVVPEIACTLENILVGPDGLLTVGFKSLTLINHSTSNWHGVDNFQLLYYGSSLTAALYSLSNKIHNKVYEDGGLGYEADAMAYSDLIDNLPDDVTEDSINSLLSMGNALLAEMDLSVKAYAALDELMPIAQEYLGYEYAGLDVLQAVWDDIEENLYFTGGTGYASSKLADFEAGTARLKAAILAYRFTAPSSAEEPLDFTDLLTNPDMELGARGWTITGVMQNKTTIAQDGYGGIVDDSDLFTGQYAYEMWDPQGNAPYNVTFEQIVRSLPKGVYTITAAISANDQGSREKLEGVYLYGNNDQAPITVKQNTSEPDIYSVSTIVTDDTLKLGYKLVNAYSNWCVADNFFLTYYAVDDATLLAKLVEKAQGMTEDETLLPYAVAALSNAISTALSDKNIENFVAAINTAQEVIDKHIAFKGANYAKVVAVAQDPLNGDEMPIIAAQALDNADAALQLATAITVFAEQDSILGDALAYTQSYISATGYYDLLSAEAVEYIVKAQAASIITAGTFNYAKARKDLDAAVLEARQMDVLVDSDITSWITNPDFESSLTGWTNTGSMKVNTAQVPLETTFYSDLGVEGGFTGVNCVERWVGVGGRLNVSSVLQTVHGLPNGEYTLSVYAKAIQQRLSVTVNPDTGEEEFLSPEADTLVTELKDVTGVWLVANSSKTAISTPVKWDEGLGDFTNVINTNRNTTTGHTTSREVASQLFSVNFEVMNNDVLLGISVDSTATANWVAFDNFTLACTKRYGVDIEEVNDEPSFTVYSYNGYINVVGADEYIITDLSGRRVSATAKLSAGLYIVTSGKRSVKVIVQ